MCSGMRRAPSLAKSRGEEQKKTREKIPYKALANIMPKLHTYDNSKRLFYDMECYDVDMCILCSAFGMNNEINVKLVEKYPDKFRALALSQRDNGQGTGRRDRMDDRGRMRRD